MGRCRLILSVSEGFQKTYGAHCARVDPSKKIKGRQGAVPFSTEQEGNLTVTAAADAEFLCDLGERAVLAHAVEKCGEDRPAAAGERPRIENVRPAVSENERDDKDPKAAVAALTAIHSFSSLSGASYVFVLSASVY